MFFCIPGVGVALLACAVVAAIAYKVGKGCSKKSEPDKKKDS